jgi:hypothetical protein
MPTAKKNVARPTRAIERRIRKAMRTVKDMGLGLVRGGFYSWTSQRRGRRVCGVDPLAAVYFAEGRRQHLCKGRYAGSPDHIARMLGVPLGALWVIADGIDMRRDWLRPEDAAWFALGARLREFGNVSLGGVFLLSKPPAQASTRAA